jgi:CIC family chloride channel protein
MAGLMAGVLHAPLTAIFMIAEITAGYDLFLPLMTVSAISYLVTRSILPHSIYTMQLAKRGDLLTHNKDQAILTLLNIASVVEKDFKKVKPEFTLGELVKVVSRSKRNLFPVIDEENVLVGVLTLDDFRTIMFDHSLYENTYVSELMSPPPAVVDIKEDMSAVMKKFQSSGAWNLPVIENGKYLGFVSKSKLFSVYRRKLMEFS